MGRGVSSGGGQSSLGYLFGSGEAPAPKPTPKPAPSNAQPAPEPVRAVKEVPSAKPVSGAQSGIPGGNSRTTTNNYHRADGQNTGNFLTDRPSTKVQNAPGGGSSLDYLFGGGSK